MWSGWRTLERMNRHTSSLRSPPRISLHDRDPQPFLEDVAAAGADAVSADVGVVDRRAEEGDDPVVPPHGHEHGHVEQLPGGLVRVVGDEHVTGLDRVERVLVEDVDDGHGEAVDVTGRAGHGLGDHPAPPVEHAVGEVTGLTHDRAERRSLKRFGLFVDGGDQALPEDLELDRVERGATHVCVLLSTGGDEAAVDGDRDVPAGSDHRCRLSFLDDRRTVEAAPTPRSLRR